jgi:hypothetical protein
MRHLPFCTRAALFAFSCSLLRALAQRIFRCAHGGGVGMLKWC